MTTTTESANEELVSTVPLTNSLQAALSPPEVVVPEISAISSTLRTDLAVQRTLPRSIEEYYSTPQLVATLAMSKANSMGSVLFYEVVTPKIVRTQARIGWQGSGSTYDGPRFFNFNSITYRLRLTNSITQQGAIHVVQLPITRDNWAMIQKANGEPPATSNFIGDWHTISQLQARTYELARLDAFFVMPNLSPMSFFQTDTLDFPLGEFLVIVAEPLTSNTGSVSTAVIEVYRTIEGMTFHGEAFSVNSII